MFEEFGPKIKSVIDRKIEEVESYNTIITPSMANKFVILENPSAWKTNDKSVGVLYNVNKVGVSDQSKVDDMDDPLDYRVVSNFKFENAIDGEELLKIKREWKPAYIAFEEKTYEYNLDNNRNLHYNTIINVELAVIVDAFEPNGYIQESMESLVGGDTYSTFKDLYESLSRKYINK